MRNRCLMGSLCPSGVDPIIHGVFREFTKAQNDTLNGTYSKEAIKALLWAMDELDGKLKVVELVDSEARLLLTHTINNGKPHISRKNERKDLTEFVINKLPIEFLNKVKHCAIDHFPNERNKISCIANYGMDLYVKVKKGFVKLVETKKKSDKSFISDERGQFNFISTNNWKELVELINNKFKQLEQSIGVKIESNLQSTFNIVSKPLKRGKKAIIDTVKSAKTDAKLDKSDMVLHNLMKWNEHGFTIKEYARSLAKLIGQGDPRTARSDLKTLEAASRIKKVRNNTNCTEAYEFIGNDQYHLYNYDLAKTRFLADVKEKFFMDNAFTVDELNEFIFEKYGLFDARSQNKRLGWLIATVGVRRHDVNPRLLEVQK